MTTPPRRASDRAYETLRQEILHWRLAPGAVLGEVEQAARLGISRTPLREALSRLMADGLVEAQSGRGLVVASVSSEAVHELFELREASPSSPRSSTARAHSSSAVSSRPTTSSPLASTTRSTRASATPTS
jgi:DNA-binding FadR family transcriptional regulator